MAVVTHFFMPEIQVPRVSLLHFLPRFSKVLLCKKKKKNYWETTYKFFSEVREAQCCSYACEVIFYVLFAGSY